MEIKHTTQGTLFFIDGFCTKEGIIGLGQEDHLSLISRGFGDEEVALTVRSAARSGRTACDEGVRLWASLLTMRVDGEEKFQIRLSASAVEQLKERGFLDLEPVALDIEKLPYTIPSQQFDPEGFEPKLDESLLGIGR
ncbi:hypothetical protein [Gordonibacter urolithinfaciens]|uniref:hypothetical protein n=1 Tax=Gordonibacter urolithinfaciens TaxID=1335613 RepID=UPI003AAD8B5A